MSIQGEDNLDALVVAGTKDVVGDDDHSLAPGGLRTDSAVFETTEKGGPTRVRVIR